MSCSPVQRCLRAFRTCLARVAHGVTSSQRAGLFLPCVVATLKRRSPDEWAITDAARVQRRIARRVARELVDLGIVRKPGRATTGTAP